MKKLLLLTLPLLLLLSCNSSDDEKIIIDHPLVGKWEFVDFESVVVTNNDELTAAIKDYISRTHEKESTEVLGATMDFRGTGKVIIDYIGLKGDATYKINGNILSIFLPNGDMTEAQIKITGNDELRIFEDIKAECEKLFYPVYPNTVIQEVSVIEVSKRQ